MAITISLSASRTDGTAPCGVYFDASGTTADGVTYPFHELLYLWNFGDSGAGNWTNGANTSQSKNFATGPVAAHLYETAGTYTVTLVVWDGTTSATQTETITVTAADVTFSGANTTYVYNDTPGTGYPVGATPLQSSDIDTAIAAAITGNGKRILFKGGDTFTSSAMSTITNNTVMFGAYGTGKPNMVVGAGTYILGLSGAGSPAMNDIWIMDWAVDGGGAADSAVFDAKGSFSRLVQLRVDSTDCCFGTRMDVTTLSELNSTASPTIRVAAVATDTVLAVSSIAGVSNGQTISIAQDSGSAIRHVTTVVSTNATGPTITITDALTGGASIGKQIRVWTPANPPTHPLWDQVFIVENTVNGLAGGTGDTGYNSVFAAGKRIAFLGNNYDNQEQGEHGIRTMMTIGGVYSNNTTQNIAKVCMTLRASDFPGEPWLPASTYSGLAVVSDNVLCGDTFVTATSNNSDGTGRTQNWIMERNYCTDAVAASSNYFGFYDGTRCSIRNNVIDLSGNNSATGGVGVNVAQDSEFTVFPSLVWVDNNTFYRSTDVNAGATSTPFLLAAGVTGSFVRNNLVYQPAVTDNAKARAVIDADGVNTVSNNTTNGADTRVDPQFVGPLTSPIGFTISAASYGANGGTASFPAQQSDFFNARDKSGDNRIGAIVQDGEQQIKGVAA